MRELSSSHLIQGVSLTSLGLLDSSPLACARRLPVEDHTTEDAERFRELSAEDVPVPVRRAAGRALQEVKR